MVRPLVSEVPFGSLLVYSPRGLTEPSVRSRRVVGNIKTGHVPTLELAMERLLEHAASSGLDQLLGSGCALVPMPRSAPLLAGALWPGRLIADHLAAAGFGAGVHELLHRTEVVQKSATAPPGERPNARQHFETMTAEASLLHPERITLVDDIVTKGNTCLGAASALKDAFPQAEVQVFALVRTLGLQPEIERVLEPCVGTVTAKGDSAVREP